jgi:hypothetical protein
MTWCSVVAELLAALLALFGLTALAKSAAALTGRRDSSGAGETPITCTYDLTTKHGGALSTSSTDGRWVWPRDLAYYVREYHVRLPPEFVEHICESGRKAPEFTREDMERLETDYLTSS